MTSISYVVPQLKDRSMPSVVANGLRLTGLGLLLLGSAAVANGQTVAVTRTYVYDSNQRLCKTIDPEAGATVVDYDGVGNVIWIAPGTNLTSASCDRASVAAGMKITRSYDVMNRLVGVATPGGEADATTTYTPDGLVASLVVANGTGGVPVTTTYAYNKRRILEAETSSQPSWYAWYIGYGYDANAHLSTLIYPSGVTLQYAPNALGQPTQVGGFASGISYYPNGAIKQFTYGNGIVHTMTPNLRGMPARSQDMNGSTAILDDSYAFDANGNVTDIIDQAQGTARGMAYDKLDRLTTAVSTGTPSVPMWGTAQYTYDAVDNLRSSTLGAAGYTYGYDANNRLATLARSGGGTYAYTTDARGNTYSDGRQTYQWDTTNRLLAVIGKEYYRYDGLGRRVLSWRPVDTGYLSLFMYSRSGQILYVEDGVRAQNTSNIYLGNTLLATRSVPHYTATEIIRYQHTDALGSPVAVTDSNRAVVERTIYAPYGAPVNRPVEGVGYTGHVIDQATGLAYMQQRYYDPIIGRFLSVDPVTADTNTGWNFNRYNYAANNPYKFKDPDGRIIDTIADVAFIVADVAEISSQGLTATNGIALVADVVGAAIPGATGLGAGVRGISRAVEAYRGSKLARNMAEAGRGVKKGVEEAHHIVAQGDRRAGEARAILERNGFGVHSAENGAAMAKADHRAVHTDAYHAQTTERLSNAENRGTDAASRNTEVRQELGKIRDELEKKW